jgi:transcriptional regulator with XRE-family HTH domain
MAEKSKEFGVRLEELMKKKGLTQKKLADLVGIKQPTISSYINDGRIPEAPILHKLAKEFGISMEELLVGKETDAAAAPASNLRRMDDYLTVEDKRYAVAKTHLEKIFKSKHEDVKKAIFSNLDVFSGTVDERDTPKKRSTPGKSSGAPGSRQGNPKT